MFRSDMARIVPTPWLPLRDPWLDDAELDLDAMCFKNTAGRHWCQHWQLYRYYL